MHESTFYSVFVYLLDVKIMKISNIGAFNSGYYKALGRPFFAPSSEGLGSKNV